MPLKIKNMKIENGKWVAVEYSLFENDAQGELLEETEDNDLFGFIFGEVPILDGFAKALEGKKVGDPFSVAIPAAEAYGEENPDAIVELEKSVFIADGEVDDDLLEVGETLPMTDDDGNELLGLIIEVKLNSVIMDFNHPLAGVDLFFDGEVKEVREATDADRKFLEEMDENMFDEE